MRLRWFGQSAFLLAAERSVLLDPFGDMSLFASRGLQFDYLPIDGVHADVVMVTHEHADHNAVDVVAVRRSSFAPRPDDWSRRSAR